MVPALLLASSPTKGQEGQRRSGLILYRMEQVWELGRPLPEEEEGGKAGWLKMPTNWKVQDRECQEARQPGLG